MAKSPRGLPFVIHVATLAFLSMAWHPSLAESAQPPADAVVARAGSGVVTVADFLADLNRLPAEYRGGFATDSRRVTRELESLLNTKVLAGQARQAGLDREPGVQQFITLTTDRALAMFRRDQIETAAGQEFDRTLADQTLRARELFVADREKFRVPEQVRVSHVLFGTQKRSDELARKLAEEIRTRALAGADFEKLAREYSDDTSVAQNGGDLGFFDEHTMSAPFTKAAFALNRAGEISPVVKSEFGYHVIRFVDRHPSRLPGFDEVKSKLLEEMRSKVVGEAVNRQLADILKPENVTVDWDMVKRLYTPVDSSFAQKTIQESATPPIPGTSK